MRLILTGGAEGGTVSEFVRCTTSTVSYTIFLEPKLDAHEAGPIVRISPSELHCSDPHFTNEIYAGPGRIRDKWQHHVNVFTNGPLSTTAVATVPHKLHQVRRAPLAKLFSRQRIIRLAGEVHTHAQRTIDEILRRGYRSSLNVRSVFNCFTGDIIAQYAFGKSMGFVEQDGWDANFATWTTSLLKYSFMLRHSFLARKMTQVLPFIAAHLNSDMAELRQQLDVVIPQYVSSALERTDDGSVLAELSSSLPASENNICRLSGEGAALLAAGSETTTVCHSPFLKTFIDTAHAYRLR